MSLVLAKTNQTAVDDGDKPEKGVEEASECEEIDDNISPPKTTENEQVNSEEKTEKGEEKTGKGEEKTRKGAEKTEKARRRKIVNDQKDTKESDQPKQRSRAENTRNKPKKRNHRMMGKSTMLYAPNKNQPQS